MLRFAVVFRSDPRLEEKDYGGAPSFEERFTVQARDVGDCVKKLTIPALSFGPPAPRPIERCSRRV